WRYIFFFFQAEDGIRDRNVTGVQTCALPISIMKFQLLTPRLLAVAGNMDLPQHDELLVRLGVSISGRGVMIDDVGFFGVSAAPQIGRASCRERVCRSVGARLCGGIGMYG